MLSYPGHILLSTGIGTPLFPYFPGLYSQAMYPETQFCHAYSLCWVSDSSEIVFQLVVVFDSLKHSGVSE